jgi:hypothetical protein
MRTLKTALMLSMCCALGLAAFSTNLCAQPAHSASAKVSGGSPLLQASDISQLPAAAGETAAQPTVAPRAARKIPIIINVPSFSCVTGNIIIYVNDTAIGYITHAGKFSAGKYKVGKNYNLYATDDGGHWGPRRVYLKPTWTKYTWKLNC